LQIKVTNWPHDDEIDACNGDLVMAITEVIAGNTIPTGSHQISPKKLWELNPKQLDVKLQEKGQVFSPSVPADAPERKKERDPRAAMVAAAVGRPEIKMCF
jgi:hypothetical protein